MTAPSAEGEATEQSPDELRARLDAAEPGTATETDLRLRLAEALIAGFEQAAEETDDTADPAWLDESLYHADWVAMGQPPLSPAWLDAQQCVLWASQDLWEERANPADLDRAIEVADLLADLNATAFFQVTVGRLRLARLTSADPDPDDADLELAIAALGKALAAATTDDEWHEATVFLGLGLAQRYRRSPDERRTDEMLDRPIELLTDCLSVLPAGLPLRQSVLYELGQLHTARSYRPSFAASGGDPDAELDTAISYLEDAGQDDPEVVYNLASALIVRHLDRPDPADRDDGIRLLTELLDVTLDTELMAEHRENIGELYLAKARAGSPEALDQAIASLERALDLVGTSSQGLTFTLVEAYCARPVPQHAELLRASNLLESLLRTDTVEASLFRSVHAVITAELAVHDGSTAALDHALDELRTRLRDHEQPDIAILIGVGTIMLARHGLVEPSRSWPLVGLLNPVPAGAHAGVIADALDVFSIDIGAVPDTAAQIDFVACVGLLRAQLAFDTEAETATTQERRLTDALTELTLAARGLPPDDGLSLLVTLWSARCHGLLGQLLWSPEHQGRAARLFDHALSRMPPDHPLRDDTLMLFAATTLQGSFSRGVGENYPTAVKGVRDLCDRDDLPVEYRAHGLTFLALMEFLRAGTSADDHDLTAGMDHLRRALTLVPKHDPLANRIRHFAADAHITRFHLLGDITDLDIAERHLRALREVPDYGADIDFSLAELELWRAHLQPGAERAVRLRAVIEVLSRLMADRDARVETGLSRDLPDELVIKQRLAMALTMRASDNNDIGDLVAAAELYEESAELVPDGSPLVSGVIAMSALMACLLRAMCHDEPGFRSVVDRIETMIDDEADFLRGRRHGHALLAAAWFAWALSTDDAHALDRALSHFESIPHDQEYDGGGLTSLLWGQAADGYWKRGADGDPDRSVQTGFELLHRQALNVFLQTATSGGLVRARDAATRATRLAVRCLILGRREQAAQAAEAGRGLVLHAGTSRTNIVTLLQKSGFSDVAAELAAGTHALGAVGATSVDELDPATLINTDDTMLAAVRALAGIPAARELTSVPGIDEVAAALGHLDADVAVYLLAAQDDNAGRALLVRADGTLDEIHLPLLRGDDSPDIAAYLAAREAVNEHADDPDVVRNWHLELDSLCGWAWRVAVGPLVDRLRDDTCSTPPRVVLIPSGALGVVPWHAARRRVGTTGIRYAVQDVVFSYAASSRQLVAAARRRGRGIGEAVTVVANPNGDLAVTHLESEYLRTLHPTSTCLGLDGSGMSAAGRGTADQVMSAFRESSLLHLACHGLSTADPRTSGIYLADGELLSVDSVIRTSQQHSSAADGPVVVLAACQSHLTQADHDEALTVASAFLAAGARGVVGTKWSVNDLTSAAMMCAFHHELKSNGGRVVDALRAAQLWALTASTTDPPGFPAGLAESARNLGLSSIASWAGFVCCGQ